MAARAVQALRERSSRPSALTRWAVVGRRAQGAIERRQRRGGRPLLGVHAKRELDFSLAPGEVQETLARRTQRDSRWRKGAGIDDHHVVEPRRPSPDRAPAPPSRRARRPNRRRSPCRRRPGCHRRPGARRRSPRCRRRTEPGPRHAQPALGAEAHRRRGRAPARSAGGDARRPSRRPRHRGDRPSRAGRCHRRPRLKSGGGHASSGARRSASSRSAHSQSSGWEVSAGAPSACSRGRARRARREADTAPCHSFSSSFTETSTGFGEPVRGRGPH